MKTASNHIEGLQLHLTHAFEKHVDFKSRVIRLNQDISDTTFDLLDSAITELERHSKKPITIKISSDGGDVAAALAIVARMERSKCKIITEAYGRVYSAATLIFVAGHKRLFSRYAFFMHHETAYELDGKHSSTKAYVEYMEQLEIVTCQLLAKKSKKTVDFYLKESKFTDKYWSPETLLSYGLIDEVF